MGRKRRNVVFPEGRVILDLFLFRMGAALAGECVGNIAESSKKSLNPVLSTVALIQ
jgi:hypothetical protein